MVAERAPEGEERSVVVGMSGATGLAVVRALRAAGVSVLALHHDDTVAGFATTQATCRRCPDWRAEPDAFVAALTALGRELSPGGARASLFVADDSALDVVWSARDVLAAAGLVPAFSFGRPPGEVIDKRDQTLAARRAGIAAPWATWEGEGEGVVPAAHAADEGLVARARESGFPLLVKPALSHAGVDAIGGKAIRCEDEAELRGALERTAQLGLDVIVQDFVPGDDDQLYSVGVFRGDGRTLAFTGRKLKQHPPSLGIARLAEAVAVPELVAGSVRLCAELGYEGVAQVEYKRDARDGAYRLMEVNFRPWTWIGLATACGVPLVAAAHAWALGGRHAATQAEPDDDSGRDRVELPQSGGRWIWVMPEVSYTLRDLARRRRPDASHWRHLKAEAFYSRRDPAPFGRAVAAPFTRRRAALQRRLAWLKRALDLAARPPAFAINAWALAARARRERVTRPQVGLPSGDRVLVLAPHPDDETIMCGATLAKSARRGDAVRIVAVTSGAATEVVSRTAARRGRTLAAEPFRGSAAESITAVREAEMRRAAAELGVRDVVLLGLDDDDVAAARERLADLLREQLAGFAPTDVYVPFPYDVHRDHVSTSLALADAFAKVGRVAPPAPIQVHCGFIQTPASPGWITRVVPAGRDWRAKRRAVAAHASRAGAIFAKPLQLAWFNPGAQGRRSEAFVDLDSVRYVTLCGHLEREGLTEPRPRSPWHPLLTVYDLERTRVARAHIAVAVKAAARG